MEQLIKKNCNEGTYENMYPLTVIQAVRDKKTGRPLNHYLNEINHIYLPFKEHSRTLTRRQVPDDMRRRGLWITYKSYHGRMVTEWYNGEDITDEAWGDSNNWNQYIDERVIKGVVEKILTWYKV